MLKRNPIRFIASQIESHLPESLRPWQDELRQLIRAMVEEKLASLGLVSRQEFDARAALIAELEARIARLEAAQAAFQAGGEFRPQSDGSQDHAPAPHPTAVER